jgi:AcrR family transcriptional regulator
MFQVTAMAQPARKPRTARGEATRQKLLDAAEALFGRQGFHATSVTDVTRGAGVAQGTFYLYFASKEEIFAELIRHLSRRLRRAIRKDTAGVRGRLAVEEAGLRSFLRFASEHRDLYRIVFESQYIDPELFRWYYERIAEAYAAGLEAAMEAGEIRRLDAETVAYALMGAAHFMGMRWVLWANEEPPAEVLESLRRFVREGLEPGAGF